MSLLAGRSWVWSVLKRQQCSPGVRAKSPIWSQARFSYQVTGFKQCPAASWLLVQQILYICLPCSGSCQLCGHSNIATTPSLVSTPIHTKTGSHRRLPTPQPSIVQHKREACHQSCSRIPCGSHDHMIPSELARCRLASRSYKKRLAWFTNVPSSNIF